MLYLELRRKYVALYANEEDKKTLDMLWNPRLHALMAEYSTHLLQQFEKETVRTSLQTNTPLPNV